MDVKKITPLKCRSVDKKNPITIKHVAEIECEFKSSSNRPGVKARLWFFVIKDSSEDLILGKPTLDYLGFVSDRYSIELRRHDIRMKTILPSKDELPPKNDSFLYLGGYEELDGSLERIESRYLPFKVPPRLQGTNLWVEGGPDLPEGVSVVEGPMVPHKDNPSRCSIEVLSDCRTRVCPSDRLVSVRKMTERDEEILTAAKAQSEQAYRESAALRQCLRLAEEEGEKVTPTPIGSDDQRQSHELTESEKEQLNGAFLVANYQKKDRKEKQAALFPELEKEIAEGYKALEKGVEWPDQTSEAYKNELSKRAEKFYGHPTETRLRTESPTALPIIRVRPTSVRISRGYRSR